MSEGIEVLRLIWGTATGTAVRGISVIATSAPNLSADLVNQVVASTHVGTLSEHDFRGAIGAFEPVKTSRGSWAVLAHYYRSPKPERTGQYFVQRDVFLVPWAPYAAVADAAALLARLPQGEAIETDGTQLERCVLEIPEVDRSRLAAIDRFDDRFIADMLSAALTESVALYSRTPQPDVIPALLLLLPPSIRRHLTFCTFVGDPAVSLNLKGISAWPKSLKGSLADMTAGKLATPITRLAITDALVQSWRAGGDFLERHHAWLDSHFKDRMPGVSDVERAHDVWTLRRQFHSDRGENRWSSAAAYVRAAVDSEADRVEAATSLIGTMRLPDEATKYAGFLRALKPNYSERTRIVDAMATTVASAPATAEAAVKIFQSHGEGAEEFVSALFAKLPAESRNIELFLRIRAAAATAVTAGDRQKAIATWAFARDPDEKQLHALFDGLHSPGEVASLRANGALAKQVTKTRMGSLALRLTELSLGPAGTPASRLPEGSTLGQEAAAATADAIKAIACARREWRGYPELALPLTTEILSRVQPTHDLKEVLTLFGEAYTRADGALLEAVGPSLKTAKERASKNTETSRVLRLADARRDVAKATADLCAAMSKVVSSWKNSAGHISPADLINVVTAENEPLEVSPAAWALLSMIADDDRAGEFLQMLVGQSHARMFLACVALAAMSESNWSPAPRVLAPAITAVAAMRETVRSLPVPRSYAASDAGELAALADLAEAVSPAASVRREFGARLSMRERAKFNVMRLRELEELLKQLDGENGGIAQLKTAVDSGDLEPGPVRDLADSLLERLPAEILTRGAFAARLKELQRVASKAAAAQPSSTLKYRP